VTTRTKKSVRTAARALERRNESDLTRSLKSAALTWLYREAKCREIAFEVRLEGPFGRIADVVGVGPENRVYLVEVKASRSDTARDNHSERDRRRLEEAQLVAQEAVRFTAGVLEAASGYAGRDENVAEETNAAYLQALNDHRRTIQRHRRLRERAATFSTKFHDPAYLRVAHCHYIMAPAGLLQASEIPPMWGLLDENLTVRVEAPVKQVRDATRHVLREIARANTRDLMAVHGVGRGRSRATTTKNEE